MILGDICTRNCSFCAVGSGAPSAPDESEPARVAKAAQKLGAAYVVITSVTRDDLPDGGAGHFAATVHAVRKELPGVRIELLIPDLAGDESSIKKIADAGPDVINHNLETVPRLYPSVRPQAVYERSLSVLGSVKRLSPSLYTKSGIMVGLGETRDEVVCLMDDLRANGCDILTIGQYLRPSSSQVPETEYIDPDIFREYEQLGTEKGFKKVFSGPFVRSSYKAGEIIHV